MQQGIQGSAKHSEAELVQLINAGESVYFEELIKPHRARVFAFVRRALGNYADAEDVTQEVLIKAFCNLHQFRGAASFSTWLHTIAFNEIRQYCRRHRSRTDVTPAGSSQLVSGEPNGLELLERESMRHAVHKLVSMLPEPARTAVMAFHVREKSLADTAQQLGISAPALKIRVFRARVEMRRIWGRAYGTWGSVHAA